MGWKASNKRKIDGVVGSESVEFFEGRRELGMVKFFGDVSVGALLPEMVW